MVRHHVKKTKKKAVLSKKQLEKERKRKQREKEEELENLDRFAGSSEEEVEDAEAEEEDNDGDDTDQESIDEAHVNEAKELDKKRKKPFHESSAAGNESGEEEEKLKGDESSTSSSLDNEQDEMEEEGNDDELHVPSSQQGMANAMARILGTSTTSKSVPKTKSSSSSFIKKPVVLSKTITPIQKLQLSEKQQLREARDKRAKNRERNLLCMHIPLSVATTNPVTGETTNHNVAKELEMERMHRRVATRGVVALFNAVSKHRLEQKQKEEAAQNNALKSTSKDKDVSKLTKYGFLEMLKKTATSTSLTSAEGEGRRSNSDNVANKNESERQHEKEEMNEKKKKQKTEGGGGWNALRDDYMMSSKLKDWDKEFSDDESSSDDGNDRHDNDKGRAKSSQNKKREATND